MPVFRTTWLITPTGALDKQGHLLLIFTLDHSLVGYIIMAPRKSRPAANANELKASAGPSGEASSSRVTLDIPVPEIPESITPDHQQEKMERRYLNEEDREKLVQEVSGGSDGMFYPVPLQACTSYLKLVLRHHCIQLAYCVWRGSRSLTLPAGRLLPTKSMRRHHYRCKSTGHSGSQYNRIVGQGIYQSESLRGGGRTGA